MRSYSLKGRSFKAKGRKLKRFRVFVMVTVEQKQKKRREIEEIEYYPARTSKFLRRTLRKFPAPDPITKL